MEGDTPGAGALVFLRPSGETVRFVRIPSDWPGGRQNYVVDRADSRRTRVGWQPTGRWGIHPWSTPSLDELEIVDGRLRGQGTIQGSLLGHGTLWMWSNRYLDPENAATHLASVGARASRTFTVASFGERDLPEDWFVSPWYAKGAFEVASSLTDALLEKGIRPLVCCHDEIDRADPSKGRPLPGAWKDDRTLCRLRATTWGAESSSQVRATAALSDLLAPVRAEVRHLSIAEAMNEPPGDGPTFPMAWHDAVIDRLRSMSFRGPIVVGAQAGAVTRVGRPGLIISEHAWPGIWRTALRGGIPRRSSSTVSPFASRIPDARCSSIRTASSTATSPIRTDSPARWYGPECRWSS